jgi:hypothetical protein
MYLKDVLTFLDIILMVISFVGYFAMLFQLHVFLASSEVER